MQKRTAHTQAWSASSNQAQGAGPIGSALAGLRRLGRLTHIGVCWRQHLVRVGFGLTGVVIQALVGGVHAACKRVALGDFALKVQQRRAQAQRSGGEEEAAELEAWTRSQLAGIRAHRMTDHVRALSRA